MEILQQRDLRLKPLSSQTNTQPFSQTAPPLCMDYLHLYKKKPFSRTNFLPCLTHPFKKIGCFFFLWMSIHKHQKNQYHSSVISRDKASQKIPQIADKIMQRIQTPAFPYQFQMLLQYINKHVKQVRSSPGYFADIWAYLCKPNHIHQKRAFQYHFFPHA